MPFVNPFTPFGVSTLSSGTTIVFRGAAATRAAGGFMARLDAGSLYAPPILVGTGNASAGLSFDAGFAPAGKTALTVSVNGFATIKRGTAVSAGGNGEAKAAIRIFAWEFSPDRRTLMRFSSSMTPVINVWACPLGWSLGSPGQRVRLREPLSDGRSAPGRFYRFGILAETSVVCVTFSGYAVAASNFIFDFPVAFFDFV